jgi:hypothetical protein
MEAEVEPPSAESGGPGYAVMHALARSLLALFYRRIEVIGIDELARQVPEEWPELQTERRSR